MHLRRLLIALTAAAGSKSEGAVGVFAITAAVVLGGGAVRFVAAATTDADAADFVSVNYGYDCDYVHAPYIRNILFIITSCSFLFFFLFCPLLLMEFSLNNIYIE